MTRVQAATLNETLVQQNSIIIIIIIIELVLKAQKHIHTYVKLKKKNW